ncbi:MAG: hypothetical protein OEY59_08405 [Deltaproteobacteria bacterium]|nr:hypothetical protein [Deltaproteobacteria bacterium]
MKIKTDPFIKIIALTLGLTLLYGCSKQQGYKLGLTSRWVRGIITLSPDSRESRPFVLARKYRKTHLQTSKGYLYRVAIKIVRVEGDGVYRVYMEDEVDRVELQFFAQGYGVTQQTFQRSLGIGEYLFNPVLTRDPNWKNSYYFLIKPLLSSYITEEQYRLEDNEQLFLGEWLKDTEESFNQEIKKPLKDER